MPHGETTAWVHRTLDDLVARLRELLPVDGVAFLVIDGDRDWISPAATWFATDAVAQAFGRVLDRPYDRERPGITEAAIERGEPLLLSGIGEWSGSGELAERLRERLPSDEFTLLWEWYERSSFISCPVSAGGDAFGVLSIAAETELTAEHLRLVEVIADLGALVLERSRVLDREAARARDEQDLHHAAEEVTRSLRLDDVHWAVVEQALRLTGADKVALLRFDRAAEDLRIVADRGFGTRARRTRFGLGEGLAGRVAATGEPVMGDTDAAPEAIAWLMEEEQIASYLVVPLMIGPRLYGVVACGSATAGHFAAAALARLTAFAHDGAAAIANALDFERERRLAGALTGAFVPSAPEALDGYELGLVYAPAGQVAGGGDLFGAWPLPGGRTAVLLGDVSGKGLEVAALSAMVRFFIEARTMDATCPSEALRQTGALLRGRLPGSAFVTAVLAVIGPDGLAWSNAGHIPPLVLRADGSETALVGTGLPLGVDDDARYETRTTPFGRSDTLFGCTDGLVEARRAGRWFGDDRLPVLLAEHGRTEAAGDLVRRLHAAVEQWTPRLDDDVVILALRAAAA